MSARSAMRLRSMNSARNHDQGVFLRGTRKERVRTHRDALQRSAASQAQATGPRHRARARHPRHPPGVTIHTTVAETTSPVCEKNPEARQYAWHSCLVLVRQGAKGTALVEAFPHPAFEVVLIRCPRCPAQTGRSAMREFVSAYFCPGDCLLAVTSSCGPSLPSVKPSELATFSS